MADTRSFYNLSTVLLILCNYVAYASNTVPAQQLARDVVDSISRRGTFEHHARDVDQDVATLTAHATVQGTAPAAVSSQSQLVTASYPLYTLCSLPSTSLSLPSTSGFSTKVSPSPSETLITRSSRESPETAGLSARSNDDACSTIYTTTSSAYCRTTLTGLYTQYTVTDCSQLITFSTDHGYSLRYSTSTANSLSTPTSVTAMTTPPVITPAPTVQTLTTNYLAYWTDLTAGTAPCQVTLKVCSSVDYTSQACVHSTETWDATTITSIATFRTEIDLLTAIHGPSELIIGGYTTDILKKKTRIRFAAEITSELTYYITSTETRGAVTSTELSTQAIPSTSTGATVYMTMTVEDVSSSPTQAPAETPTTQASTLSTQVVVANQ